MKSSLIDGFNRIHKVMTEGQMHLDPDAVQLQSYLIKSKMDVEDLKSLLTNKDQQLEKMREIIKTMGNKKGHCIMSGEFLGAYGALKARLIHEQELLKGVKVGGGHLSIDHFIEYIRAVTKGLDIMVNFAKKCENVARIAELQKAAK